MKQEQQTTQEQEHKQIIIQALREKNLSVCSVCNNTLFKEISFKVKWFRYYKVINFICSCGYNSNIEIKISKEDYKREIDNKRIVAENTTNKFYEQEYKQIK